MPPPRLPRRLPLPRSAAGWLAMSFGTLCLGIEAALAGADAGLWGSARWRPWVYQNGAFWAGLLGDWRPNYAAQPAAMFLTYAFLHGGAWHLLGNLAALWALVRALCARLDAKRLLGIWVVASVGGALTFGLLTQSAQPMVGASGALFGLAGAWMVWQARALKTACLSRRPILRSFLVIVALHPVLWLLQNGLLAWETHLGGFLAGAAFAHLVPPGWPGLRRAPGA